MKDKFKDLSKAELEIAKRILYGKSNKQMAEELFVTVAAIKFHLTRIYKKLGVKNKYQFILTFTDKKEDA